MGYSDASQILTERLSKFRSYEYAQLAAKLGPMSADSAYSESVEGKFDDGGEYQVDVQLFWDDRPGGNIRVAGGITTDERSRINGFPSLSSPNACDSFIKAPDGRFVDE